MEVNFKEARPLHCSQKLLAADIEANDKRPILFKRSRAEPAFAILVFFLVPLAFEDSDCSHFRRSSIKEIIYTF